MQRSRQHSRKQTGAVNEVVDRKGSARVIARLKLPHVVADARQTLEAAFAIEEILDVGRRHAFFGNQIEHDARIDLAGPRAHRQPVERGEPHGALDAAAAVERAHRGAAAEMGDDHPLRRNVRRDFRQDARDIFVGQTVEAVAPDAFGIETLRDRVMIGQRAMAAMKGGVEAGDLRQIRETGQDRTDRRQIVRLMKRRQRNVAFQSRQYVLIDPDRPVVVRAAMHDAMPDRNRIDLQLSAQPGACCRERGRDIADGFALIAAVDQHGAIGRGDAQPRPASDAVHLALDLALQAAVLLDPEDLELDARRAGIGDEDGVHDTHAAATLEARRRASA